MWFIILPVLLTVAIYTMWWKLIDEPSSKKLRDLGLSLVGGIVGIAVFGGLIVWLCFAIAGMTHEPLAF